MYARPQSAWQVSALTAAGDLVRPGAATASAPRTHSSLCTRTPGPAGCRRRARTGQRPHEDAGAVQVALLRQLQRPQAQNLNGCLKDPLLPLQSTRQENPRI